jgi:phospholipid/cholesterol/gamma-HCH transport system substrate-binding protein
LLKGYGGALQGRGAEGYRNSLKYWKGAYRDGAIVADAQLGLEEHDLSEYLRSATKVAQALDREPAQLQSLIEDFDTTANAFARRSSELQSAIAELPRTLRAAQPALGSLNASFPSLRALARDLRPGVQSSGPAIDASMPLVKQLRGLVSEPELRGLVADLRSSVPALNKLTDATVPLYEQVRLASSCQNEVILPWSQMKVPDTVFPAEGKVYEEATKPLPGLAGESRSGDANGQWFRVLAAGGMNLVTLKPGVFAATSAPISGTNPPKPSEPPPLRNDVPCETQQAPNLQSKPGPPPPQRMLDPKDPKIAARYALDKARFLKWFKKDLKREGLAKLGFKVSSKDVTPALLAKLAQARQAAHR